MDANTPAWLRDNTTEAPPPASSATAPDSRGVITSVAPPSGPPPAAAASNNDDENDPDLPGIILTMRLANMSVAIAMMVVSVLQLISFSFFSHLVLSIYAMCGSLLICCLETQLKFVRVIIALNFGFLFSSIWRFIYYMMMASIGWSYGKLFGKIVAIAFVGVALFNTYVLCRYPSYRKMREKIAEEEDKRIEAKISKEVKKKMGVPGV